MAKVITVAQRKGGSGKTSLALHLAAYWSVGPCRVALLDTDPQKSLSDWFALRQAAFGPGDRLTLRAAEGWKAGTEVPRLGRDCDIVLIDTPPHAETAARTAMRGADLVLVPMQPSPMDQWATQATLEMAAEERVPALVVFNRVPPRGKMSDRVRSAMAEQGARIAAATLGNRQAYASSLMEGRGVSEAAGRSQAAAELAALADEIWRQLD